MADCLACLAEVAGARGRPEQAVQLFGVAEALLEASGARLSPNDRAEHHRQAAAVRAALDEEAFKAARAEGRTMALDEAVTNALQDTADAGS
jgi:hypothetical protein